MSVTICVSGTIIIVEIQAFVPVVCLIMIVKGKAIPLQALTGPEGSRRLKLPDFKTVGT
jgi:hypothetical protein